MTPGEIAANMSRRLTGSEAGLAAYYRLEEAIGGLVIDRTAGQSHGQLLNSGDTEFIDVFAKLGQLPAQPGIDLNADGFDELLVGAVGARSRDQQRLGVGRISAIYGSGTLRLPGPQDTVIELANRTIPGSGSFVERRAAGTKATFPAVGASYTLPAGSSEQWFRLATLGDGQSGDVIRLGRAGLATTKRLEPTARGAVRGTTVTDNVIQLERREGQTAVGVLEFDLNAFLDLLVDPTDLASATLQLNLTEGPTATGANTLFVDVLDVESDGQLTTADGLSAARISREFISLGPGSGQYNIDFTAALQALFTNHRSRMTVRLQLADSNSDGPWLVNQAQLQVERAPGLVADLITSGGNVLFASQAAIDLRSIPAGSYFLRVATDDGQPLTSARNFQVDVEAPNAGQSFPATDRDVLRGGDGDDLLVGNDDYDYLFGESGTDAFIGEDIEVHDRSVGDLVVLDPPSSEQTSQSIFANPDPIVDVPDAALRDALLRALGKPVEYGDRTLRASELASIVELDLVGQGIQSLAGIEHLGQLRSLVLSGNSLTNAELARLVPARPTSGPFAGQILGLSQLRRLSLDFNPLLTSIAPLKNLRTLSALSLDGTAVDPLSAADLIEPLSQLPALQFVSLPAVQVATDHNLAGREGQSLRLTLQGGSTWQVRDSFGNLMASGLAPNVDFTPTDNGVFTLSIDGIDALPIFVANRAPVITNLTSLSPRAEGQTVTAAQLIADSGLAFSDAGASDVVNTFVSVTDPDGNTTNLSNVALEFDGVDDYVQLDEEIALGQLTQNFTVAAWIRPRSLTQRGGIIGGLGFDQMNGSTVSGWALQVTPGSQPGLLFTGFSDRTEAEFQAVPFVLDQWTHVAFTYSATNEVQFFVNGQPLGNPRQLNAAARPTDVPFTIGDIAGLNSFFDGLIDDVVVFNRAIPAAEIAALQANGVPLDRANLVGFWQFNEGLGTVSRDASVSGHDGVLGGGNIAAIPRWNATDAFVLPPLRLENEGTYQVEFKVIDDDGDFDIATTTLEVTNQGPTASITATELDIEVGTRAMLHGRESTDPGPNDVLAFDWQVATSTGQVIYDGSGVEFSFVPERPGFYEVTLTVTDSAGDSDTQSVIVSAAPQVAVAVPAGPLREGDWIEFASNSSTPAADNAVRTYVWEVRRQGMIVANETGRTLRYRPSRDGQYQVQLLIVDTFAGQGSVFASAQQTFDVENVRPSISLPATATTVEGTYTLPLQVSDAGSDDLLSVFINWGDNTSESLMTSGAGLATLPTHGYAQAGNYTINVVAVDDGNAVSNVQVMQLEVTNRPPSDLFLNGPSTLVDGNLAVFSAAFSDVGNDSHTATWNFGDGSPAETVVVQAGQVFNRIHTYLRSGSYAVTLTVTDSEGAASVVTKTIDVVNLPPSNPTLGLPSRPTVGTASLFGGNVSDFSGDVLRASLDFGDGTIVPVELDVVSTAGSQTTYGFQTEHVYRQRGTFSVTLTILDADGKSSTVTHILRVGPSWSQMDRSSFLN